MKAWKRRRTQMVLEAAKEDGVQQIDRRIHLRHETGL